MNELRVSRRLSLDAAVRKAKEGDRIVVPAGEHQLTVCPRVGLAIAGDSAGETRIRLPRRLALTTSLALHSAELHAEELALEIAGGTLSTDRARIVAGGTAVFVHGGGTASLRASELVSTAGEVGMPVVEAVGAGSKLTMERGWLRGPTGAFVHDEATARLEGARITGEEGPAVRAHAASVVLTRCRLRGGESGLYVRDGARAVLRACSLARSRLAQIEARGSFVRVVGGTISDGEDDGIDAHDGSTLEVESVRLRGNDIAIRVIESRAGLLDVVVEDGRGAGVVADAGAQVDIRGGTIRARDPAALEAFDGGVIRARDVACENADGEPLLAYDGGRIELAPGGAPPAPPLDDDACWRLVDDARVAARRRRKGGDVDGRVANHLVEVLARTDIATITRFDAFVRARLAEAYRWDLWGVAYVMNGGCSDDGFDYFLGWLVGQGRERYAAALRQPELAAEGCSPADEPFSNEDMLGIGWSAYRRLTGSKDVQDFYDVYVKATRRRIAGTPFDEDTIMTRYPSLARFN
jgi:hypothetical protein